MQIFRKIFSLSAFLVPFDKLHIQPNSRRQNVSMWLVRLVCVCVCPRAPADPRSGVRTPVRKAPSCRQPTMRPLCNCVKGNFYFFFFFLFTRAYICIYKCFLRLLKTKKKKRTAAYVYMSISKYIHKKRPFRTALYLFQSSIGSPSTFRNSFSLPTMCAILSNLSSHSFCSGLGFCLSFFLNSISKHR